MSLISWCLIAIAVVLSCRAAFLFWQEQQQEKHRHQAWREDFLAKMDRHREIFNHAKSIEDPHERMKYLDSVRNPWKS